MGSIIKEFESHASGKAPGLGFHPLGPDQPVHPSIELCRIERDPSQPRKRLGNLDDLKHSIRDNGVIQPVIVSPLPAGRFRLIAGERRYAAALALNLDKVPAVVRQVEDHKRLEVQISENLHRKDLDPFEEAAAYARMVAELGMTHDEIALKLHRSRTYITQLISLNRIPADIRTQCQASDIAVSKDSLILVAKQETGEQMRQIVGTIFKARTKEERRRAARKGPARTKIKSTETKFTTGDNICVTVASPRPNLDSSRVIGALREALEQVLGCSS